MHYLTRTRSQSKADCHRLPAQTGSRPRPGPVDPGNYDSDSGEPAGAAGPWSARTFKFAMAAGGRAPPVPVICYSEIAIATGPGPGLPAWALAGPASLGAGRATGVVKVVTVWADPARPKRGGPAPTPPPAGHALTTLLPLSRSALLFSYSDCQYRCHGVIRVRHRGCRMATVHSMNSHDPP